MNVKFVDDIPMHLPVIQKVFERSYGFYTAGLRMYFALIPMFAWLVSSWLLMAYTLPHLYLVYSYDNMDFIEKEVSEMYSAYQPLLQEEKQQELAVASIGKSSEPSKSPKEERKKGTEGGGGGAAIELV